MTSPHERVVVGVDGSEPSRQALRWGLFLAQTTGAGIDAVMAWMIPAFAGAEGVWPADWNPQQDAADVLHRTVAALLARSTRPSSHDLACVARNQITAERGVTDDISP